MENNDIWKNPPSIKIYEALGCIADGRIQIKGTTARVSSSGNRKVYDVSYDPGTQAIRANDNGSYWQGYLGYPAIAYLCEVGEIGCSEEVVQLLSGIDWKELNKMFKNDYDRVIEYILSQKEGSERKLIIKEIENVSCQLKKRKFLKLGKRMSPPKE